MVTYLTKEWHQIVEQHVLYQSTPAPKYQSIEIVKVIDINNWFSCYKYKTAIKLNKFIINALKWNESVYIFMPVYTLCIVIWKFNYIVICHRSESSSLLINNSIWNCFIPFYRRLKTPASCYITPPSSLLVAKCLAAHSPTIASVPW